MFVWQYLLFTATIYPVERQPQGLRTDLRPPLKTAVLHKPIIHF
jgi:hypothetical protein